MNNEKDIVLTVIKFHFLSDVYPKIKDRYEQVFSNQTAYQITSILEGVIHRGTGKN